MWSLQKQGLNLPQKYYLAFVAILHMYDGTMELNGLWMIVGCLNTKSYFL